MLNFALACVGVVLLAKAANLLTNAWCSYKDTVRHWEQIGY